MILSGSFKFWWLLLVWICLMPLSLWISCGFKTKSWKYYLSHLSIILLMVGAITSSALGKEVYAEASVNNGNVYFDGISLPISELVSNYTIIKTLPLSDIIIQCSIISPLPQGGFLIPYTEKPMILVFWAGCLLIIAQPCIVAVSKRLKCKKVKV
jgi:cytochrome c biogenesis factor